MRDIEWLWEKAGLGKLSKSTAQRICSELRERFEAFKRRDQVAALFLDAVFLSVRPDGPKEGVLVAWGFNLGEQETDVNWTLREEFETAGGIVRWRAMGSGDPVVLVHGTPYSSLLWRDIAPALALTRRVFVFDLLGFGQSDQHDGQDLGIAAQAKLLAGLLAHWELSNPSLVAHDIGGAVTLRALLLEGAGCSDLTLFDAVSGGQWERGLFQLILDHAHVFEQLPDYAHEALVASHMRHATYVGYRAEVLDAFLEPWRGPTGRAAFYRQYSQIREADTAEYEHLLAELPAPTRLIWGTEDRILPPQYAHWLHDRIPHAELSWIEDAGHVLQEDAPAQLLAHLTAPVRDR